MGETRTLDLPIATKSWDYARGQPFDSYVHIDQSQKHGLRALAEARIITELIQEHKHNPDILASDMVKYIFTHSPMVLDLPPQIAFRYNEAKRIMNNYPFGEQLLNQSLIKHFAFTEQLYKQKQMLASTTWITRPDIKIEATDFEPSLMINLPDQVAARGHACAHWCQFMIKNGDANKLFNEDPQWSVVKLGSGAWLPVGNLMVEVCQGVSRIQSPAHDRKNVISRLGFAKDVDAVGPREYAMDPWVIMTHIIDKQLLGLLEKIGEYENPSIAMIEDHKLNVGIYCRSYPEIIHLMRLNPLLTIRGVLSDGTWIYWSGNEKFFPNQEVARLHRVAGKKIVVGTADELGMEAQIKFATMNPERRAAYENGQFPVTIVARFINEQDMIAATKKYGDDVAKRKLRAVSTAT